MNSVKTSLFSSQTLGGLVSLGASIGLDAIGAPPILQSFVPKLLVQLTAGDSGSSGGGGGPGQSNTGSVLSRIGDFAKGIGQTIINGAQKVGQAITSFGQAIANGFGQAVEKVSNLIPRQIKEFFVSKGNGDLAAGVQAGTQTNGEITESAFGNYRLTYNNITKELAFANDRSNTRLRNVELGQDDSIFSDQIDVTTRLGDGSSIYEVYDSNGVLQELRFNDDVEILLNNNPFSKIDLLNFQNSIVRVRLDDSNLLGFNDSYLEFKNVDGKLSGDIKIDLNRTVTLKDGIEFVNGIGQKLDAVQNVIGIPNAFADNITHKGYEPPQGKYAIKIFVDRPKDNKFGDHEKIRIDAAGQIDVGHTFVAVADNNGNIIYKGLWPAESILISPFDPNHIKIGDVLKNLTVLQDVKGDVRNEFDSSTGKIHDYDVTSDWFEIDQSKYQKIIDYINNVENYNLAFRSCAGFALDIAQIADIDLSYHPLFFSNPQDFADALEKDAAKKENR